MSRVVRPRDGPSPLARTSPPAALESPVAPKPSAERPGQPAPSSPTPVVNGRPRYGSLDSFISVYPPSSAGANGDASPNPTPARVRPSRARPRNSAGGGIRVLHIPRGRRQRSNGSHMPSENVEPMTSMISHTLPHSAGQTAPLLPPAFRPSLLSSLEAERAPNALLPPLPTNRPAEMRVSTTTTTRTVRRVRYVAVDEPPVAFLDRQQNPQGARSAARDERRLSASGGTSAWGFLRANRWARRRPPGAPPNTLALSPFPDSDAVPFPFPDSVPVPEEGRAYVLQRHTQTTGGRVPFTRGATEPLASWPHVFCAPPDTSFARQTSSDESAASPARTMTAAAREGRFGARRSFSASPTEGERRAVVRVASAASLSSCATITQAIEVDEHGRASDEEDLAKKKTKGVVVEHVNWDAEEDWEHTDEEEEMEEEEWEEREEWEE